MGSGAEGLLGLTGHGDEGGSVGVVDAHHHLINLETLEYPWITRRRPELVALLRNYYEIAHSYDVAAYLSDVAGRPLSGSVACEFGAADGVAEAEWVQRCAESRGFPDGFIAAVDLSSPSAAEVLARYRELSVVCAVRQPLYWAREPLRRLGARPDYLSDRDWWRGFERVAEHGFVWDLLVYDEQLPDAQRLISSFPETKIVLEAAGWPLDQTAEGFKRWEQRLEAVSEFPNVTLKLQGLALLFGPSAEAIGPWARGAARIFGPGRCMFASHFPVDRLLWSFDDLLEAMEEALGDLDPEERHAIFAGCATEVYGLG
jgi:predicted TIM-barrel fold metal-dependent hydrolase